MSSLRKRQLVPITVPANLVELEEMPFTGAVVVPANNKAKARPDRDVAVAIVVANVDHTVSWKKIFAGISFTEEKKKRMNLL